ncbi:hypothetical protein Ahy_B05g074116 [Arachis hypogaea]|uniref:Uncharacterized protein n=1 Tax=Arachis hypogaea TaxID=3818 RepID=A0A444YXZ7_ARAHY|nr:hypothetical protein Ahy_B05g074116 [Arachis hypogaea]
MTIWPDSLSVKNLYGTRLNLTIKKIFDHQMARQLQHMLEDIRKHRDYLTIWLHPNIKKSLYVHWETDEGFKYHRLTNKANRAWLGRQNILFKSLDRDATIAETFKYTHTLEENKERFAYQWATNHYERSCTERLEAATQQSQRTDDDGNNSAA